MARDKDVLAVVGLYSTSNLMGISQPNQRADSVVVDCVGLGGERQKWVKKPIASKRQGLWYLGTCPCIIHMIN